MSRSQKQQHKSYIDRQLSMLARAAHSTVAELRRKSPLFQNAEAALRRTLPEHKAAVDRAWEDLKDGASQVKAANGR